MRRTLIGTIALMSSIGLLINIGIAAGAMKHSAKTALSPEPIALSSVGKHNILPSGGYFTWRFDKEPKIGSVIVIIQAYSKAGKKENPYKITGEYGMPEMHAHDSGPIAFQLNKKGDYLLPVEIAMPGEWRITIRIKQAGKQILIGYIEFAV